MNQLNKNMIEFLEHSTATTIKTLAEELAYHFNIKDLTTATILVKDWIYSE